MRNAKTVEMTSALALTTSYQTVEQPSDLGAVVQHGGQVVLTFKRTSGSTVTFQVEEYMGEDAGWVSKTEDNGTTLAILEKACTEADFSFAFTTLAEKVRVQVKATTGSPTLQLLLTVGEVL